VGRIDQGAPVEWCLKTLLALFEGLEEFRCPGDGMGALDSGARENVVQWCLGDRRVRQKSSIEIQHTQKSTELTGGIGRMAILEMGHSFFQRLETLAGHLITEEGDLRSSKDTLRQVDADAVPLKLVRRCCSCSSSGREKMRISSE
jgi:hypothetical protein